MKKSKIIIVIFLLIQILSFAKKESRLLEFEEHISKIEEVKEEEVNYTPILTEDEEEEDETFFESIASFMSKLVLRVMLETVTFPYWAPMTFIEIGSMDNDLDSEIELSDEEGMGIEIPLIIHSFCFTLGKEGKGFLADIENDKSIKAKWNSNIQNSIEVRYRFIDNQTYGLLYEFETTIKRLNFKYSYTVFIENSSDSKYNLEFNEFMINYIFARDNNFDFKTGFGKTEIKGNKTQDALKFNYSVNYFKRPYSADLDFGIIYTNQSIFELKPTVGYFIGNLEIKGGYTIQSSDNYNLNGAEIGLKYWF